jgi:hypothetical protein
VRHDLSARDLPATACVAAERPTVLGDPERLLDRALLPLRAHSVFSSAPFGALRACGDRDLHGARENRKHREIVEAIERHGPPPGWRKD